MMDDGDAGPAGGGGVGVAGATPAAEAGAADSADMFWHGEPDSVKTYPPPEEVRAVCACKRE